MSIPAPSGSRSPFNRLLPVEIKTKIFSISHQHAISHDGPPIFSKTHPSVIVSHVSKEWREVALSTPQLWADLHVVFPRGIIEMYQYHPTDDYHRWGLRGTLERLSHKLTAWLDRSGSLDLTVTGMSAQETYIDTRKACAKLRYDSLADLTAFNRVRMLVIASSSRWSSMKLPLINYTNPVRSETYMDNAWYIRELLHWVDDTGDIAALSLKLSSLMIEIPATFSDRRDIVSILAGHTWGALQELTLLQTDWRQADDILELLRSSPGLVTLEIHPQPAHWTRYTGRKIVALRHLRSITFGRTPPPLGLHEMFVLPALKSFTLSVLLAPGDSDFHSGRDPKYRESLTNWMERFGSGLTELNLVNGRKRIPSDTWLIRCLTYNLIPNVTHLRCIGRTDHDFLLHKLVSGLPSGDPCCPRLEEFVSVCQEGYGPGTLSKKAVLDFLVARLDPAAVNSAHRLRYVEIRVSDQGELDILAELEKRVADLKDVTIKLLSLEKTRRSIVLDILRR